MFGWKLIQPWCFWCHQSLCTQCFEAILSMVPCIIGASGVFTTKYSKHDQRWWLCLDESLHIQGSFGAIGAFAYIYLRAGRSMSPLVPLEPMYPKVPSRTNLGASVWMKAYTSMMSLVPLEPLHPVLWKLYAKHWHHGWSCYWHHGHTSSQALV